MNYNNYFGIGIFILIVALILQFKHEFYNESSILLQYDFIVVGGGTAGCVVAGQLAVNSNYTVLLVEAGSQFNIFAKIPVAATFFQRSKYDWSFKTVPQIYSSFGMINQSQTYPRGKGLGGSGQLNYLVHMEPSITDYKYWQKYNITTWNYTSLYPYFRKMLGEYEDLTDNNNNQPQKFMYTTNEYLENSELAKTFEQATKEMKNISSLSIQSTILHGKRWTSYDGYLKPFLHLKNLHILLNTRIKKVLFSNRRAIGIETNSPSAPRIYVRKEIILSAGTVQTPQILLLSGVGPKKDLEKLNIPVVSNVPEVGKNLHDHFNTPLVVSVEKQVTTTSDKIKSFTEVWKYVSENKGLLSHLPIMGIGRTPDDNTFILFGMGTTDETVLREIANWKPEIFRSLFPFYYNSSHEGFILLSSCLQPKSRGIINLIDNDYRTYPNINPNYLENYDDVQCMLKGLQTSKQLLETKAFKNLGVRIHWPKLEPCKNFIYLSKNYLECYIRTSSLTGYHPGGTCRMGNDDMAVVNENLRVKGVRGLRIVDASVMPSPLTHFPNSGIIAIAHRATSLIINKK